MNESSFESPQKHSQQHDDVENGTPLKHQNPNAD
jgi:hypothetical protein